MTRCDAQRSSRNRPPRGPLVGIAVPAIIEESIPTGEGQYSAILGALKTAEVVIILLSSESARRPWVAFEAGYGMGRNSQLFPVLVRGCQAKHVPSPFSEMQVRPLNSGEVEGIVTTIERLSGLLREPVNIDTMLRAIWKAEAGLPNFRLELAPYVVPDKLNPNLHFRLVYEGIRPIKLE